MANTNIKLFDENKSNMMSDADYGTDTQRSGGVQTGVASSQLQNKFQYQMSLVAYAIAQLMLANGKDALDSSAVSTFVSNLSNSVVQKVLDKATAAEVTAGTNDTHWVTPKNIKSVADVVRREKQDKITASGPLVGNGNGGVSAGAWPCNPNMLDNWYWANPVNQRGQTAYNTNGKYTIDRWRMNYPSGAAGSLTVNNGYVTLTLTSGQYVDFYFFPEKPPARYTVVTLTALLDNGTIITRTGRYGNMAAQANQWRSADASHVAFRMSGGSLNIVAVKMELGDTQTLCHMDGNGKYVLNEIPNYQQQLAQCQRYCFVTDSASVYKRADIKLDNNQFWFFIPCPVPMRANPIVESSNVSPRIVSFSSSTPPTAVTGFSFAYTACQNSTIRIQATKDNHGMADASILMTDVVFSAENG